MSHAFFNNYFEFVGASESPTIFHRWVCISMVGSLLGRNVHIPFGHGKIYPNQYVLLTGGPGTRKGTAIGIGKKLLEKTGYDHFAPNKASKETFWAIMAKSGEVDMDDMNGDIDMLFQSNVSEMYIAQDEFIDFLGLGADDLVTNLTNLWDNLDKFDNPKQTKQDIHKEKPTINILSGATPGGISECFGMLAMSGGFFSRMLFIYGGSTQRKIAFPEPPNRALEKDLVAALSRIRNLKGEMKLTPKAKAVLTGMYDSYPGIADRRFAYYGQRRFTHLLKLCTIITAMNESMIIDYDDVIFANTMLHLAEQRMPNALGEYGKARNSDVANMIMEVIKNAHAPINIKSIWKQVSTDLNRFSDLTEILNGMREAGKIDVAKDSHNGKPLGYIPKVDLVTTWPRKYLDYSMLREDEQVDVVESEMGGFDLG